MQLVSQGALLAEAEVVDVDVLIVGGGVSGLFILNELRNAGYAVALVERTQLGGEQTNHSHLYLHRGHVYNENIALARRLRDAAGQWDTWLEQQSIPIEGAKPCDRTYFGFASEAKAIADTTVWDEASIAYTQVAHADWPKALQPSQSGDRSVVTTLYETGAICVTGEWLIDQLTRNARERIGKINDIEAIEVNQEGSVAAVQALTDDGARTRFRPRMVVLAGGFGNHRLVDLLKESTALRRNATSMQVIRWAHMLVIRGRGRYLAPLTGIFDPSRLFLVSRQLADGDTVWIVSDEISPDAKSIFEPLEGDERVWFRKVWRDLQTLAPRTFGRPERFKWGIYSAPKAEVKINRNRMPGGRVDSLGIPNVRAVWPTKLTLAPAISRSVLEDVTKQLKAPTGFSGPWTTRRDADVARERWTTTGLLPWDDFRHRHR